MPMTTTTATPTGLVGLQCEVTGEPVSFSECLACAQRGAPGCPMIPAVIHTIPNSRRDAEYANALAKNAGAKQGFSVTELLACPRQYTLKRQYPYREKPSTLYRMSRGTAYHTLLGEYPDGIREETLTWKFNFKNETVLLVGTPDLIEVRQDGWYITDYKLTDNPPIGRKVNVCARCEADLVRGDNGPTCPNCGTVRSRSEISRAYRLPQARSSHILQITL